MAITNHVLTTEHLKQIVKHNNDTFATKTSLDEAKKAIPVVDSAISSTSTNPVQNKAIYTELGKKFDTRSEANDGSLAWYDKSRLTELGMTAPKLAVQSISDPTSMAFIGTSDISVLKGSDDGVTSMHTLAFTESNEDGYDANVPAKITSMDAKGKQTVKKLASTDYVDTKVNAIKPGVTEVKAGATADKIAVTTNGTASTITVNNVAHATSADNATKVNGLTVETAVPKNAKFTDTVYTHPNSGVTAGTYRSVTVDAKGHVTAGTNPTTLAGYGITDAKIEKGVITLGGETITPLTAHQSLSNYYNKSEVDSKISTIPKFAIAVVTDLPTKDISKTTIYLKKTGDESQNIYTEYIYVNNGTSDVWEELGTQKLDLSGYLTKTDASNTYVAKNGYIAYTTDEKNKLAGLYQTGNTLIATKDILSAATVALTDLYIPDGYTPHVGDHIIDSNGDHYYITAATSESVTVGNAIGTNPLTAYQKTLTFDDTPKADSINPVTSGGIAKAIEDKASTLLGKKENAVSATKATQDGDGNVISTTYIKATDLVEATEDEVTAILNGTSK